MKRVATVFLSLILFAGIIQTSSAQTTFHRGEVYSPRQAMAPITMGHSVGIKGQQNPSISVPTGSSPLAVIQTDAVSYFQDTIDGNWWVYAPVFSAGPDSLGFLRFSPILYESIQDSIGPVKIGLGNGQFETDFDTMYTRVMALRVSVPTDIKSPRLDSASITLLPISMSPRDSIEFWVVPIEDVQFFDQNNNPTNYYPIPDLFASTSNGTYIAKGSIKASELTVGNLNTVTVNFLHKTLGTRKQFGICAFVDGPDFVTDTIGYQLDANLQSPPTPFAIDTDGSIGILQGIDSAVPMRTYKGNLDGGHLILGGGTQPSLIGGINSFFVGFSEFDATSGQPTGNIFAGNLVMTTYMSGTSTAGVEGQSATENSLAQCYPNPVNMSTEIPYNLATSGPVSLKVYNSIGEEVATVMNHVEAAGAHSAIFNTNNLPNGIYYYKLQSGDFVATQNMVVNK
jgi:hypothetical protein